MNEVTVEKVLRAVELVPRGSVITYGDLGALVGIPARQVGRVLAEWGSGVPWWRVVNAAGDLPSHLTPSAHPHWAVEGIGLKRSRRGCRLDPHRADLALLMTAWEDAVSDLPQ